MTHTQARSPRRLAAVFLALALLLCACFAPREAAAASDGMIRVWLTRLGTRSSLSFTATCAYYVDGNTARPIPAGAQATVEAIGGELYLTVDGALTALGPSCTLARAQSGTQGLRFTSPADANLYCGDLLLSVSGGSIVPILRIYIEDYLYGVVGYEMSNSWPLEALKAQAVAARNYALRCMSTRSSNAYHMVDTASDQVFRGYEGSSSIIRAVDETRSMALHAGSAIASCYYSASNGGQTEATRNVWGGNLSYSTVKDDPYDLANPSATVKTAAIRRDATGLDDRLMQALRQGAGGAEIAAILDIEPHSPKYAAPSRLYTKLRFTVETVDARQFSVDVDTYGALEAWYGLSINSSSNETVYVEESADGFTIAFRRWGHGVGMSQRGAQTMAQQGMGVEDILAFYYPGTQLRTLSLSDTTGSGLHDGGAAETPLGQAVCIGGATLYAAASTGAQSVGSVPAGALVDVYEAGPEWSRVGYGLLRGWAQTALFALPGDASPTPSPSATPAPTDAAGRRAVVTMDYEDGRLYLRSGPSTDTAPVTTVRNGETVTAYAASGEWTAVETDAGARGYLKSKYLVYIAEPTLLPVTPSPSPSPTPTVTPVLTPSPTPTAAPTLTASPTPTAAQTVPPTVFPTATATPTPSPQPTPPPLEPRPYGAFARVTLSSAFSQLNLRQSPSLHAAILDRLSDGEYVEILADKDGWARVETTLGRVGYVQTYYLRRLEGIVLLPTASPTASPTVSPTSAPTATPTAAPTAAPDAPAQGGAYARVTLSSASSQLNLRQSPSTAATVLDRLDHGEIVRVLAASGNWVRIETASGQAGYVQSRYLTPIDGAAATAAPSPTAAPTAAPTSAPTAAPTATPTAAPTAAPDAPAQGGAYARVTLSSASSQLNLRQSPSTAATVLDRLDHGEIVRVLAASGNWVRIETASGQAGYVQSRYLTRLDGAATPAPTATPGIPDGGMSEAGGEVYADIYVSASGGSLNVRQGPSTQTPVVTTVSHGSWVQVLATDGEWSRVRTRLGNEGYLKTQYLIPRGEAPGAGGQSEVVRCDLEAMVMQESEVRTGPAADAPRLAVLPAGTQVRVKAYNDEWAQVFSLSGSSSGFVLKAHLRLIA